MRDGVYQVTTRNFVAGFVIENGKLKDVAPILKRNILFWLKVAKRISHPRDDQNARGPDS